MLVVRVGYNNAGADVSWVMQWGKDDITACWHNTFYLANEHAVTLQRKEKILKMYFT